MCRKPMKWYEAIAFIYSSCRFKHYTGGHDIIVPLQPSLLYSVENRCKSQKKRSLVVKSLLED
ncbi:MAG TPA: hypothetical protein V6D14_00745 [Coleofasciculaceae cyanobacterium]